MTQTPPSMSSLRFSGKYDSKQIISRAEALYHRGQCDEAVDLLLAASQELSNNHKLRLKLVELLIDSEQFADAETVLQEIPALNIGDDLVALIGRCQVGMGKFAEAIQTAQQLLESDRYRPLAHHIIGMAAYYAGNLNSAEVSFEKAIEIDHGFGEAYQYLGLVNRQKGRPGEALRLMRAGFDRAPTARYVVLTYHKEIESNSDLEKAAQSFRNAIGRYPVDQRLRYLYIDILLRLQRFGPAIDAIEDCLGIFGPQMGLLNAAIDVRGKIDTADIDASLVKGPRISLCMITKNEEHHLPRCLSSVKKIVDEIIVVDTGSEDHTVAIAHAFGAKVFQYEWDNDFARARNCSLAQATGDWVLILDADECIAPQEREQLRSLLDRPSKDRVAFSVMTRNYTLQANLVGWKSNDGKYREEEAGTGWYPSQKVRCFPNDRRIRFSYPIHELVEPSLKDLGYAIEICPIPIHHYGKLSEEKNNDKALAYYRLGKRKLADLGDNAIALREMAVQAGVLEKYDEAADMWQRYLHLVPDNAEAYINMGTACWHIADYQNAARHAKSAIALAPDLKEAHFNSALAQLYLGDGPAAIDILEKLLQQHHRYLAARFMLAAAYACMAAEEKARVAFNQIRDQITAFELKTAVSEVADRLSSAKLNHYAQNLIQFS